jgi:CHAD domain-containing protein
MSDLCLNRRNSSLAGSLLSVAKGSNPLQPLRFGEANEERVPILSGLSIPKYGDVTVRDSLAAVQSFPERHRATIKSLGKRLEAFLDDPNEENLHDLRISIRRADASVSALRKGFRERRKTKRLLNELESLMRRSAKVRDLDTVRARLLGYPANSVPNRLLRRIEKSRARLLRSTTALAASTHKLSSLRPDAKDVRDEKEVRKRLNNVVKKLRTRVNLMLPLVLTEPEKTKELHSLRKDCKRLRYTLELMPVDQENSELIKALTSWQDLLGEIRDGDVTISYLEGLERSVAVDEILRSESTRRRHDYQKFAGTFRENSRARLPG